MIIGEFNTEAGEIKEGDKIGHPDRVSEQATTEKTYSEDCDVS